MPIPNPQKGEKQEDFISRCERDLADDYPQTAQRTAICEDSWRRHKNGEKK